MTAGPGNEYSFHDDVLLSAGVEEVGEMTTSESGSMEQLSAVLSYPSNVSESEELDKYPLFFSLEQCHNASCLSEDISCLCSANKHKDTIDHTMSLFRARPLVFVHVSIYIRPVSGKTSI